MDTSAVVMADKDVDIRDLKRQKIKTHMRGFEKRQREKSLPTFLHFGTEMHLGFNRHICPVNSLKWNPDSCTYASLDEKSIYVWEPLHGVELFKANFFETSKTHAVSCFTYTSKHRLYLVFSTKFQLLIFSEYLEFHKALSLEIRSVNFAEFHEESSQIVTGGVDGVHVLGFHVGSKYDGKKAEMLDQEKSKLKG